MSWIVVLQRRMEYIPSCAIYSSSVKKTMTCTVFFISITLLPGFLYCHRLHINTIHQMSIIRSPSSPVLSRKQATTTHIHSINIYTLIYNKTGLTTSILQNNTISIRLSKRTVTLSRRLLTHGQANANQIQVSSPQRKIQTSSLEPPATQKPDFRALSRLLMYMPT